MLYVTIAILVVLPLGWPVVAPDRMLIIGHSGDVAHWPRNSLPSIKSAAASAADGLEFDVNRSSDGTWWMFHDPDLTATTTGVGNPHDRSDAEMAQIRVDAGMGVDPSTQNGLQSLSRLSEALDALAAYKGVIIVDCKDERPGAHRALAQYLAGRDMYMSVIARSAQGAAEIKAVSPRFRVITQQSITMDPNVDVWLADASYEVSPPRTTIADTFGELGMFVGDSHWGEDERAALENGRRWGVQFVITNNIGAALAWRDGVAD